MRFKVKNRKKFNRFITITTLFILMGFLFITSYLYNIVEGKDENYHAIIVSQGDTLWDIANKNVETNRDIRNVVYDIRKINKLKDSSIKPGDIIYLPHN